MDNQLATKSCLKATKGLSRYCGHIFFNFFVYIYFNWNINLMKTVRNWFPEFAWDPLVLSVEKICILTSSSGVSASTFHSTQTRRQSMVFVQLQISFFLFISFPFSLLGNEKPITHSSSPGSYVLKHFTRQFAQYVFLSHHKLFKS